MPQALQPGSRVHVMGIGGFGMNPIARVMHALGYAVTGCDMAESALLPPLRAAGIPLEIGHDAAHVGTYTPDALVVSSAIPAGNPEIAAARAAGLPVYKRADVLCQLMQGRTGIAVAGTHGKTTTTGMLATALDGAGLDPTFIIGGVIQHLGENARAGQGRAFVIEADEYDRMFMGLCPQVAIVTTLEMDHPDMFADFDAVRALFDEFAGLLPADGLLIAGFDDPETRRMAYARRDAGRPALTYGLEGGDWQAVDLQPDGAGGVTFSVYRLGEALGRARLRIPGAHNVQNALAALAAADAAGAPPEAAIRALAAFEGMGRRFEVVGQARGVTVIDDYAHHPTAIRATLDAARARYGDAPIWAVWQPHTYSRTHALLAEFAASFAQADHAIITDVYRSRDADTFGIGPGDVLARMPAHPDARHIAALADVTAHLAARAAPGDVVIVMSAGDATEISRGLLAALGEPARE